MRSLRIRCTRRLCRRTADLPKSAVTRDGHAREGLAALTGGRKPVDPACSRCLKCERDGTLQDGGDCPDPHPGWSAPCGDLRTSGRDRPAPRQPTGNGACEQGRRDGRCDGAENIDRPMNMRGDPSDAKKERDGDQDDAPPSGMEEDAHGQKHAGDRVIGGKAIVHAMRKVRGDVLSDEGPRVEIQGPAELDQRQGDGAAEDCPDDELPLLLARQAQPDDGGNGDAQVESVLGSDDDEGVHLGSLRRGRHRL